VRAQTVDATPSGIKLFSKVVFYEARKTVWAFGGAEERRVASLEGRAEGLVFRSKRNTPLVNYVVLNKHLHPLLRKLGLERGGMHGFRHHRVSTLAMACTPMVVIKKRIGHGSEDMVDRYTHLRPDFMRDELARAPDFAPESGPKIAEIDPFDPEMQAVA
jgi:integrase